MRREWGLAIVSLLILAMGLSGVSVRAYQATPAAEISVAEQREIEIDGVRIISLSPDGATVVAGRPMAGFERGEFCTFDVATLAEKACADLSGLIAGLRTEDVVWSPDSSKIAFAERSFVTFRDGDLWLMDAATGELTNVTDDGVEGGVSLLNPPEADITEFFFDVNPAWSPDGQSIAFSRSTWRDGEWRGNEIAVVPAAGGEPRTIAQVTPDESGVVYLGIDWQANGSRLFYNVNYPNPTDRRNGIWVIDADGQNVRQVAGTTDSELGAPMAVQVAPKGDRVLAYYVLAAAKNTQRGPHYAIVDVASGEATPLTVQDPAAPEEAFVGLATLSPDGSKVLYVSRLTEPENQVFVRDLPDGEEVRLVDGLSRAFTVALGLIPTWASDGSVLMNSDLNKGTLLRLDGGTAASQTGTPVAVATEEPGTTGWSLTEQRAIEVPDSRIISLSPDGKWIAAAKPASGYPRGQLCVYDLETLAERSCGDLSGLEAGLRIEDVTWSPDGSRLAFAEQAFVLLRDGDLWLMDAATGAITNLDDDGFSGNIIRLTSDDEETDQAVSLPVGPAFSPDGRTIAFSRSIIQSGEWRGNDIAVVSVDGGEVETLTRVTVDVPGVVYLGVRWAPDGSRLYYAVHDPDRSQPRNGLWVVDADGLNQRQIVRQTDPEAGAPAVAQVAPDGKTLLVYYPIAAGRFVAGEVPIFAVVDAETGAVEPLLVRDPNAPEMAWVGLAVLSPDGTKVLTLTRLTNPDKQVWVEDVDGGNAVQLGEPLIEAGWVALGLIPTWASDGSVLIPGGGAFSTATVLRIAGSEAPPVSATVVPETPGVGTPTAIGGDIAPGATVVVNDDGVRLRAAPSRDAAAVLEMDRGTELVVIGEAIEAEGFVWWPVEEPETRTIGWVRAEFLSLAG
jgi:Tol biopolymer transport system component